MRLSQNLSFGDVAAHRIAWETEAIFWYRRLLTTASRKIDD